MKLRIISLSLLFMSYLVCAYAQNNGNRTYYYELIALVKNGKRQAASGDGHYLTINKVALYESDGNGISKGKGTVYYMDTENGRPTYEGSAYLGDGLTYIFNSDFSQFNLRTFNGTTYIYQRKSTPTSSRMRVYNEGTGHSPSVSIPSNFDMSNERKATNISPSSKKAKTVCSTCNGTKYVNKYIPPVSELGVKRTEYYTCNICGKRVSKNGGHGHKQCPDCHGTGYVYK